MPQYRVTWEMITNDTNTWIALQEDFEAANDDDAILQGQVLVDQDLACVLQGGRGARVQNLMFFRLTEELDPA